MSLADASRRLVLADAIRREGGEWTTRRVQQVYRRAGLDVPQRKTWRDDLARLHRSGLLTLHDDRPNCRYYTRAEPVRVVPLHQSPQAEKEAS